MANIYPFRPLRYSAAAGPIEQLVTQPYDTIPPELEARYRAASPHNLVHLILPHGDYAGAAARFRQWVSDGVLVHEERPAIYWYEQRFCLPEGRDALVRRGFTALGDTENYGAVVHRHEQTLDAPKADRLELLKHTRAQFGSIFMLYEDAAGDVEEFLDAEARRHGGAQICFVDEWGTSHELWRVDDPGSIARAQEAMRGRRLLIADGHHRYEAALAFGAPRTMMTFVRLESDGLQSLAAHRVVAGLPGFRKEMLRTLRDGVSFGEPIQGALTLNFLHERVLRDMLGITPEDVAQERYVRYRRGRANAIEEVRSGHAQVAFLVEPLRVDEVARKAFGGEILPQKSTDFYPKLHSGLTIYDLDQGHHARDHRGPG